MSGRGGGEVLGKSSTFGRRAMQINRAASPPPPGGLGTRSLVASPQIKTTMTTFALGHFSGHTAVVTANAP